MENSRINSRRNESERDQGHIIEKEFERHSGKSYGSTEIEQSDIETSGVKL